MIQLKNEAETLVSRGEHSGTG